MIHKHKTCKTLMLFILSWSPSGIWYLATVWKIRYIQCTVSSLVIVCLEFQVRVAIIQVLSTHQACSYHSSCQKTKLIQFFFKETYQVSFRQIPVCHDRAAHHSLPNNVSEAMMIYTSNSSHIKSTKKRWLLFKRSCFWRKTVAQRYTLHRGNKLDWLQITTLKRRTTVTAHILYYEK